MDEHEKPDRPHLTRDRRAAKNARAAKLAAAMRTNLRRRKDQARQRAEAFADDAAPRPPGREKNEEG